MKIYRLFSTLLAIIGIACLFGVQGQFQEQYVTPSNGYSTSAPSAAQNPLQYSQFYTITPGSAPSNPIGAPQQFEIAGNMPSTVYLGEQMQPVPYSQYQSYPAYAQANSLWIKGATDWTQYAVVPQGATVSLYAISPTGGSGSLAFMNSDGQTYSHNYIFYPNSLLTFYADTIGRHMLSFDVNGQSSNQVVIDVIGTYTQPSNYPEYYPGYYYPDYYVPPTSPDENNNGGHTGKDHKDWNPSGHDKGGNIPGGDNNSPNRDHKDWNPSGDNKGANIPGKGHTGGNTFQDNNAGNQVQGNNSGGNRGMDTGGNNQDENKLGGDI